MSALSLTRRFVSHLRHGGALPAPVHGRDARAPIAIPWRGWLEIAGRTAATVWRHRATTSAAAITFYAMLAFIPALTAAAAIYGLMHHTHAALGQALALDGLVPTEALSLIEGEVGRISTIRPGDLGWMLMVALVATIGSVNAAMDALVHALNTAYGETECRPFAHRTAVVVGFTAALLLAVPAVFAALLIGRSLSRELHLAPLLVLVVRFAFLALVATGGLAMLYRYGPCRRASQWRWVTPGGILAAVAWLLSSAAVSVYFARFGHYEQTYGVLGAVLAILGWLWTAAAVVVVGAELNAQLERQTDRDTSA